MKSTNKKETSQFIPTRIWDKNCFGCSPANSSGLQMKCYTDEKSIFSWVKVPRHLCGWNRLAHGGTISTILDEIMGWTAIHLLKVIVLTKSMTVDFVQPVFLNEELEVEGWIEEFDNDGEVKVQATLRKAAGELCAKSSGIFSYFSPDAIRGMGIMDDACLKEF